MLHHRSIGNSLRAHQTLPLLSFITDSLQLILTHLDLLNVFLQLIILLIRHLLHLLLKSVDPVHMVLFHFVKVLLHLTVLFAYFNLELLAVFFVFVRKLVQLCDEVVVVLTELVHLLLILFDLAFTGLDFLEV